jgi:hypothetical protein
MMIISSGMDEGVRFRYFSWFRIDCTAWNSESLKR